jgi:hypothetical protein
LDELLTPGGLVIVETYPREFYGHLGVAPVKKKEPSSRRLAAVRALPEISWPLEGMKQAARSVVRA